MSSRLARTLLKLYPRRIRDRYGDELLDLQDKLRAHDDLSRMRLIQDMLAGALLARPRRVYLGLAAVLVTGALAVGGAAIAGLGAGSPARGSRPQATAASTIWRLRQARHAPTITAPVQSGSSCFVSDGSSCSLRACSEWIARSSSQDAVADSTLPATRTRPRSTTTRCTAYPRVRPHRPVFVSG